MANFVSRALTRLDNEPYLLIVLATLMWGGNAVAGRLAVGEISPMSITCLRWLLVCVIFALTMRKRIVSELPSLASHWPRLAILGALGFTLFNALFYFGAQYTTAINIAVLQGTFPALVLIGMAIVYKAPVSLMQAIGILVTFCGVGAIASHGELDALLALRFNRGDLMLLVATAIFAGYTIGLRNRPKASAIVVFAALAGFAFLTSVPFLMAEIAMGASYLPTAKGLAILAYTAICPSLLAQIFYIRGVELIGPSRTGVFYNLVPVFGGLLAVLIIGEPFHLYHAVAFVLVLGGIWLSERAPAAPAAIAGASGRAAR